MHYFRYVTTLPAIAALCSLSLFSGLLAHTASAETETGDRPVIKVPRGGGRAAFEKFGCITCHLADDRGGQNEGGYGADLRVTKLSEQEIVQTISEGRVAKGMPSFKGMIDGETIAMLAKFIKEDLRLK